jgi:hypothetical protein
MVGKNFNVKPLDVKVGFRGLKKKDKEVTERDGDRHKIECMVVVDIK